ncbi:MAG: type II toxin-antitoxin system RelE/ParE family toxin [Candidatus Latescibacterota bacterium]
MPSEPVKRLRLEYTPEFKRSVRVLSRRYRHIRSDLEPIIDRLVAGERIGDRISGMGFAVWKVRVRNSDVAKGKSSGYRLVYFVSPASSVVLVALYSKLDQGDVTAQQVRRILAKCADDQPE